MKYEQFFFESEAAASSYQFLLDLRRAQQESLREAEKARRKRAGNTDAPAIEELVLIKKAQELSLEENRKREEALKRLQRRLECPWNLKIATHTDDTGNCQFDAAADQLHRYKDTSGVTHQEVRQKVVDWLKRNPDYRLGDTEDSETLQSWVKATQGLEWADYCKKMSVLGEWGDELTMIAITEVFQCRIFLWSSTVSEENYFSEHLPKSFRGRAGARKVAPDAPKPLFESTLTAQQVEYSQQIDDADTVTEPTKTLLLCHVLEVHYGDQKVKDDVSSKAAPVSLSKDHQLALLKTLFGDKEADSNPLSESIVEFVASAQRQHLSMAVNTLIDLSHKNKPATASAGGASSTNAVDLLSSATTASEDGERKAALETSDDQLLSEFVVLSKDDDGAQQQQQHAAVSGGEYPGSLSVAKLVVEGPQVCLAVYFEAPEAVARPSDFVALAQCDAAPGDYRQQWPTGGAAVGLVNCVCPPSLWGRWEFRWLRRSLAIVGRSPAVELGPRIALACEWAAGKDAGGRQLLVRVTNSGDPCWTAWDWVGLYPTGEPKCTRYLQSQYVVDGQARLQAPPLLTSFDIRFFSGHRKYQPLASLSVYINKKNELIGVPMATPPR